MRNYITTTGFHFFDCIIVLAGLVDVLASFIILNPDTEVNSITITVLRAFRILRMFKIARYWRSFEVLLNTLWMTLLSVSYFGCLLLVILYVYTLLGIEFFANKAKFDKDTNVVDMVNGVSPTFNFDNFLNSLTTTFVILTKDGQSTIFYNFYRSVSSTMALGYWLTFIIFAEKILLTVFNAMLLQNFDMGMLKSEVFDKEKLVN